MTDAEWTEEVNRAFAPLFAACAEISAIARGDRPSAPERRKPKLTLVVNDRAPAPESSPESGRAE